LLVKIGLPTMETLAYIHLEAACESPENLELKWFKELNWTKLPSSAWIRLGAIAISLALVGIASNSALALNRGNRGSQVTALQQQLAAAGYYSGPITGFYGSSTQASVRRFQQARGLPVDGVAGPNTLAALNGTGGSSSTLPTATLLRRGSRGSAVTQLQRTLAAKGFYSGPVTGYYGGLTEAAVRRFQQARGLRVDGVAGSSTLVALNGATDGGSNIPTGTQLQPGSSGPAVTQLQNRLRALGFYKGPVTGFYSRLTEAAVRDFQGSRRISVNGIAGPTTLAALQGNSSGNVTNVTQLQRGSRGAAVTQLQNRLRAVGVYNGPVTGYYGELTEAAVRRFQSSRRISVNGIAGPTTLAALQGNYPGSTPSYTAVQLQPGSRGAAVTQLQNRLRAVGVYNGPVTGYYGQLTEVAVRDFQRSRGLSVNGIAGPTTLAVLQGGSSGSSTSVAMTPLF
jgi:peptidoglycan hydrolase-like protein with peptidoglycan-binding domain